MGKEHEYTYTHTHIYIHIYTHKYVYTHVRLKHMKKCLISLIKKYKKTTLR